MKLFSFTVHCFILLNESKHRNSFIFRLVQCVTLKKCVSFVDCVLNVIGHRGFCSSCECKDCQFLSPSNLLNKTKQFHNHNWLLVFCNVMKKKPYDSDWGDER